MWLLVFLIAGDNSSISKVYIHIHASVAEKKKMRISESITVEGISRKASEVVAAMMREEVAG